MTDADTNANASTGGRTIVIEFPLWIPQQTSHQSPWSDQFWIIYDFASGENTKCYLQEADGKRTLITTEEAKRFIAKGMKAVAFRPSRQVNHEFRNNDKTAIACFLGMLSAVVLVLLVSKR